jgi:hypothetical protein
MIVDCNVSIEARCAAGLDHLITNRIRHMDTIVELLWHICKNEDRDVAGRFAVLVWTLWENRNNKVWHGEYEGGSKVGLKE